MVVDTVESSVKFSPITTYMKVAPKRPSVVVIIPTMGKACLNRAIASVQRQTYRDYNAIFNKRH